MDDFTSNTKDADDIIESIKQIIINADRWIEIFEIAELLNVHRHQRLIADDINSSIAQLISRELKKQGFKTKRINYDKSYSIWVSPPGVSDEDFPLEGYEKSDFLNKKSKFKKNTESFTLSLQHRDNAKRKEVEVENKKELCNSDSILNFANPDMLLKILLAPEKPYEELKEFCEKLVLDIKTLHTNENGLEYPSQLSQCILECFKVKNNFLSSTWYSCKNAKEHLTSNSLPISFSRITAKGEMVNYKLYNLEQLDEDIEDKNASLTINNNISEPMQNVKLKQLLLNTIDSVEMRMRNQRNSTIYKLRYALLQNDVRTLEDIASVFSISRERVRQIINGVSKRLKRRIRQAFRQKTQGILYELYSYLDIIVNKIIENSTDNKVEKVFIEQLLVEEFQSSDIIYLKLINQLTDNNFEILKNAKPEKLSDTRNKEIRMAILACIREFSGLYGRTGIAKILKGSNSLKNSEYNNGAIDSNYFGLCKQLTLSFINTEIDELINEGALNVVNKNRFNRPFLTVNPDIEIEKMESFEETSKFEEAKNDDENVIKVLKALKQGENIFLTGHAGTGKSYILNKLKEKIKSMVLTSTTGIAAVNIKGQSLHSWAGVGICNKPIPQVIENILKKTSIKNQIQKCKILAIDEISMLNIETFEYVDLVLRGVRDVDKPFGGIQVVLIGDFLQLPPVSKNKPPKYCFESNLWDDLNLHTILLTKNYRQSEETFINALSNMRINSLSSEDINLLKSRESCIKNMQTNILHIFATNNEADNYNSLKFNKLNTVEHKLYAIDGIHKGGKFIESPSNEKDTRILQRIDVVCSAEKSISLKIGARVMLLINLDFKKGLINGSCGDISEINDDFVLVRFDNGVEHKIERHDFEFFNNDVLIAIRRQFPLRLAYGITIHKSQGMSLDELVVDCSRIFEKGQAYVAMSRVKRLEGLHLNSFNPAKVLVDEKIVKFYNNLKI